MYTETVKCGTVRGSLTCDTCGGGYHWQTHIALCAACDIRRSLAAAFDIHIDWRDCPMHCPAGLVDEVVVKE